MKKPDQQTKADYIARIREAIAADEKEYSETIERARSLRDAVQDSSPNFSLEIRIEMYGIHIWLKQKRGRYLIQDKLYNADTFDDVEADVISAVASEVVSRKLRIPKS